MRSLIRRLTDHIAGWISSRVVATNNPITSREKLDTGYLHGLRAIASLWVLTFHVEFWSAWYRIPIPNGGLAVDLFMILSGFLMALLASQRWHMEPLNHPASWLEFYARRFFRIAPAYYISLLAAGVLAGPFFWAFVELSGRVPYLCRLHVRTALLPTMALATLRCICRFCSGYSLSRFPLRYCLTGV